MSLKESIDLAQTALGKANEVHKCLSEAIDNVQTIEYALGILESKDYHEDQREQWVDSIRIGTERLRENVGKAFKRITHKETIQ